MSMRAAQPGSSRAFWRELPSMTDYSASSSHIKCPAVGFDKDNWEIARESPYVNRDGSRSKRPRAAGAEEGHHHRHAAGDYQPDHQDRRGPAQQRGPAASTGF